MAYEYLFFDQELRERFLAFARELGVTGASRQDDMAGDVVELPDTLDETVLAAIDAEYERLFEQQSLLADADADWISLDAAGVTVTLADGTMRVVRVPSDMMRSWLAHFSPDEISAFASAIARGLERGGDGPVCCQPADD